MAIKTFLAFSCVHCPDHDPGGIDWLVKQVADRQPEVIVNLGDMIDTACLSSFARARDTPLDEEFDAADAVLTRIMDAAPSDCKLVLVEGNHEERCRRPEYAPLAKVLDYRRNIPCASAWKHIPRHYNPRGVFRLGQVSFCHGFNTGVASCKREAIQLGVPNGLYVHGHTHRPHPVHRIALGATKLPYWHANAGTFIKPNPDYMESKDDSLWGQAIVVGHANTKRTYDHRHGWDAETIVNKMHWSDGEDVVAGGKVVA